MGAGKAAHVFHDPDNRQVDLAAKGDRFPHVGKGNVLWGSDDDGSIGIFKELHNRKGLVAGPRRAIDNQVIKFTPCHILEKLSYHTRFHRSAPDDRFIAVTQHEAQ